MKCKVSKEITRQDGILYILRIRLEDKNLVKVGVTCRDKVEDRVCEILTSVWKKYRIFPETYVKRFKVVTDVYSKESKMHKLLEEYSYKTEHRFSGSTEMFDVHLDVVVDCYDKVMDEDKNND